MNQQPVRLSKQMTLQERMEAWLNRHAPTILFILIVILMILIMCLIGALIANGGANTTMVESGNYYNHFQDVI